MEDQSSINSFIAQVWSYYRANARAMPWRENPDPYWVLVSEMMLQQTQVNRVMPKFAAFMERFPSIAILANASLIEVLQIWQGLGYNRRAKYLLDAAKAISATYHGVVPRNADELRALPGIGVNTAHAILVYAYQEPHSFIETNIRAVFIYHFFQGKQRVSDHEILPFVSRTIDRTAPREWYWALMDYGNYLKQNRLADNIRVRQHKKPQRFQGSLRQLRGKVLRLLIQKPATQEMLSATILDDRIPMVLKALCKEGMVNESFGMFKITN